MPRDIDTCTRRPVEELAAEVAREASFGPEPGVTIARSYRTTANIYALRRTIAKGETVLEKYQARLPALRALLAELEAERVARPRPKRSGSAKSGIPGVYPARYGRWRAIVYVRRKNIWLGSHPTKAAAAEAVRAYREGGNPHA